MYPIRIFSPDSLKVWYPAILCGKGLGLTVSYFKFRIFKKSMRNEFREIIRARQNSDLFRTFSYFAKYETVNPCCERAPPPPPIPARATSWRKIVNWELPIARFLYTSTITELHHSSTKGGGGRALAKKAAAAARFLSGFLLFSHWKRGYFEVLKKFKKNGYTNCDPYKILKKYLA